MKLGSKVAAMRAQRETQISPHKEVPLSASEKARFAECERVVRRNIRSFFEAGAALMEIKDSRLYRDTHASFSEYCRDRWDMSRQHAYRLIDATAVVTSLTNEVVTLGDTLPYKAKAGVGLPTSERQARPLAQLPAEERGEAWAEVVAESNGKPTVEKVEEVVGRRRDAPTPLPDLEVVAELERADREIRDLRTLNESLSSSDLAIEVQRWAQKYGQLEGRLRQESVTRGEAERTAKYRGDLLRKVREMLGVEADKEIVPAIQDLLR